MISFTFGDPSHPHIILLLSNLPIAVFLHPDPATTPGATCARMAVGLIPPWRPRAAAA